MAETTTALGGALRLLRTSQIALAEDVRRARRGFWIGSGISCKQVPGLEELIGRVLNFLHQHSSSGDDASDHREALLSILDAYLPGEKAKFEADETGWVVPDDLQTLVTNYSEFLETEVGANAGDYLLWVAMDVRETYGSPDRNPGLDHHLLALLILEGLVPELASGNWDGLIEKAVGQRSYQGPVLHVCMTSDDEREGLQPPHLYKFHGCAVRARQSEAFRPYLVASKSQISGWSQESRFASIRGQLANMARGRRALFLGLSMQDYNLLNAFGEVTKEVPWEWDESAPAFVFAVTNLGVSQQTMLKTSYKDAYDEHRDKIRALASLGMHATPILAALLVDSVHAKYSALIDRAAVNVLNLSPEVREALEVGLCCIEADILSYVGDDYEALVRIFDNGLASVLRLFFGVKTSGLSYLSVRRGPISQIESGVEVLQDRTPVLASLLALLGLGRAESLWSLVVDSSTSPSQGVLLVSATGGNDRGRGIVIVRDAASADEIFESAVWSGEQKDALTVLHASPSRTPKYQRSASRGMGSNRDVGSVSVEAWVSEIDFSSADPQRVLESFRQEVGV